MSRALGLYTLATLATVSGAVMTTQGVYDPANASASFRALGLLLLLGGVYGGARAVKSA